MSEDMERLGLKWGTLKAWSLKTDASREALKAYWDAGDMSAGAMQQHDTPEQKKAICAIIDAVSASGGQIYNDWSGEDLTADEAKKYVMEYGS